MVERKIVIISASLIALYGAVLLFSAISLASKSGIDVLLIIAPSILTAMGIFTALSYILDPDQFATISTVNSIIGTRLIAFFIIFQGAAFIADVNFIEPLYSNLGFDVRANESIIWISLLILFVFHQLMQIGIEIDRENGLDAFMLTRAITRLVFTVAAVVVLCLDISVWMVHNNTSIMSCAVFIGIFALLFEGLRIRFGSVSPFRMVLITVLMCAAALFVYMLAFALLGWVLNWLMNLTIVIPIVLLAIIAFLLGNMTPILEGAGVSSGGSKSSEATIYYRGKDASGKAIYGMQTNKGSYAVGQGPIRKLTQGEILHDDLNKLTEEVRKLNS